MTLQEILKLSPAEQVIRGHEILMLRAKESGMKLGEELGEKRGDIEFALVKTDEPSSYPLTIFSSRPSARVMDSSEGPNENRT